MLLSPTVQGLQNMVSICEVHASQVDLLFSTDPEPTKSKTMCIAFGTKDKHNLSKVKLNGDPLPWKDQVNHLGTTLYSQGTCRLSKDVMEKRARFIQRCYDLNQEFDFADCETRLRMLQLYNTAFFSSNNWLFSSEEVHRLGRSWNVNLRILFNLPMDTHCWIVENLSGGRHLRQMLFTRFIKYIKSLAFNKRLSIRTLFNVIKDDVRSTTGSNIRTILLETMVDPRELKPYLLREWVVHPPQDE